MTRVLPSFDAYMREWQRLHNAPDIDVEETTFLRRYLAVMYRASRPIARAGVGPMWITFAGVLTAIAALISAHSMPVLAAALVVASALLDGIDGGVAALTGRATRLGFVIDSVADRIADALFVTAVVRAGGDGRLAVAAMAATLLLEYTRARAGNAGLGEVGVVTVGERPTRVIACALGLVGGRRAPDGAMWVVVVASMIGMAQLMRHLARVLDEP